MQAPQSPASRLRALIARDQPLIAPGVHDPLTAVAAEDAGFESIYYGGLMTALQLRDSESVLTMPDAVEAARRITSVVSRPLIVDAEGGFGGPINVTRTTRALEAAGVAAFHIEDSSFPRDGHQMVSIEAMCDRIKAALDARTDPATVVIARTEAYAATGGDLSETMRRLDAYRAAGADALLPMVFSRDDAQRIGAEFATATLIYLGLTRRSHDSELTSDEIHALGYRVVLYPILTVSVASAAVRDVLRHLAAERVSGLDQADLIDTWKYLDSFTT